MENQFRLREVAEMLNIGAHRIEYAQRHRQVPIERPHRYAHHWYTWQEIRAIANWFGIALPAGLKETK